MECNDILFSICYIYKGKVYDGEFTGKTKLEENELKEFIEKHISLMMKEINKYEQ